MNLRSVRRLLHASSCAMLLIAARTGFAQVEMVPSGVPAVVFAGRADSFEVRLKNAGETITEVTIDTQWHQLSSATMLPLRALAASRKTTMLAGQTIVERLTVALPEVRVPTVFRVSLSREGRGLGTISVIGIPPDLLAALSAEVPVGVFEPTGEFAKQLEQTSMRFSSIDDQHELTGGVAILGPFASQKEVPSDLSTRLARLAQRRVAALVLLPPAVFARASVGGLLDLQGVAQTAQGKTLVASSLNLRDLPTSAVAQLTLHQMLSLAAERSPFPWPESSTP